MSKFISRKVFIIFAVLLIIVGVGYFVWEIFLGGAKTLDPELLVGTNDILVSGEQNFSLSPDGKWLFYSSMYGNAFEPIYILYDIERREKQIIGLSPRTQELASEGRGPLQLGCWDQGGFQFFLPGDERVLFRLDIRAENLQLEALESVQRDEYFRYYECPDFFHAEQVVQTNQISPKEIRLMQNSIVLATHKAKRIGVDRIDFQYPTISLDREIFAYVIYEYRGSFVASSRGYLLVLETGELEELADPVFGPMRWSPDSSFVYASAREFRGDAAIYRWRIPER